MNNKVTTENDLKTYKTILETTNYHMEGFGLGKDILIICGPKFTKVIAKLFPETKRSVHWVTYKRGKMTARLYYDLGKPSAFSSLAKLQAAIKQTKGKIFQLAKTQAWLERLDAYTLHENVRKYFP